MAGIYFHCVEQLRHGCITGSNFHYVEQSEHGLIIGIWFHYIEQSENGCVACSCFDDVEHQNMVVSQIAGFITAAGPLCCYFTLMSAHSHCCCVQTSKWNRSVILDSFDFLVRLTQWWQLFPPLWGSWENVVGDWGESSYLVVHEALHRGGFVLFENTVYEDLISMHAWWEPR